VEWFMRAGMAELDPEIYGLVSSEFARQRDGIELIASENFVPLAILEAQGSILTNKYAEGYPHKKYYGGCEFVETVEEVAIRRACDLFGAEHANVQPHSGTQANMSAFFTFMAPGDTMLAMSLDQGGHLSHGHPLNFTGKLYRIVGYGVTPETETIDYEAVERLAKEHRPRVIVAGASAYPRFIDFARFAAIAAEVGAVFLVDMAHIAGLVAGRVHPSPVPHADFVTTTTHKTLRGPRGALILCKTKYAQELDRSVFPGTQGGPFMHAIAAKALCFKMAATDEFRTYAASVVANAKKLCAALAERGFRIVSGGTDNHLILVDVKGSRNVTGKDAEKLLEDAGITVNKNMIPFDKEKPFVTSGVRLGTAAVTTRGMGEAEMERIAEIIDKVLSAPEDATSRLAARKEIKELSEAFPLYPELLQAPSGVRAASSPLAQKP
jgi:glycine hydroxymethyltransferase